MQYKKLSSGKTIIEFHNNWLGVETVIVNGQTVSKQTSFLGCHHHFNVLEDGHMARYVLTTKMDMNMQVLIDLKRNGKNVYEDEVIPYSSKPNKPINKFKKKGILKVKEYDLEEGIEDLKKALDLDPDDSEIYFYMACAYSILEKSEEGFEAIKSAVANRLTNTEEILNHDMLAYLRMNPAFEGFFKSNFTKYDKKLIQK